MSGEGKWTPGPWRVGPADLDGRHQFTVLDRNGRAIVGADALAEVFSGYGKAKDARSRSPEGQTEAWANAQVAAAAPEMFEALRKVLAMFNGPQPGDSPVSMNETEDAVRAALAKAEKGGA